MCTPTLHERRRGSRPARADAASTSVRRAAILPRVKPGDVVADRFVVERRAGAGGMGVVFRAFDRNTGEAVALKTLHPGPGELAERFLREAQLLAELPHPAIVRYVAHGATGHGEAFLAMEWLEGEDLDARLARLPLDLAASLALAARLAAALAAAHARGVVHRDVKPSNVLLVGGDPARAKLLDLGLARPAAAARAMTTTNAVVGTVGYMAPEQARGERDVDARADVFSLGCVLYECLAGRPAFAGEHVVAVLAKVLLEQAPRLAELRPDLPAALDALVGRMLAKDREERFADAGELARALAAVDLGGHATTAPPAAKAALSAAEQRLVSVVLVDLEGGPDPAGSTLRLGARDLAADASLAHIVASHGASIAPLATGALLVTLAAATGALDGAARAAECALALRRALPEAHIALATGRAQSTARGLFGQVVDRAARLLAGRGAAAVRIDDATRGLLEARFDVKERAGELVLAGRRADAAGARTLLGKPTPCVGRDKELALLAATFAECVAEPVARVVLVTAAAGMGKSRLRHELVARLRAGGGPEVLVARGEPMTAGSSLGLVRQLVRAAAVVREGASVAEQQAALGAHLAALLDEPERTRATEFLAEVLGIPLAGDGSPELRAARDDPRVMAEWLRRSFEAWLAALCRARPLLVVLEDLHWGDALSVAYLTGALRALRARPLMLLALARPAVHELFPKLWAEAEAHELRLAGLTRSAAERLARAVLGDALDPEVLARVVARADGNAFHLEELLRRVAESESDELPETVLAVAEARFERLEPAARRILRAASVFGEVFWQGAVAALLGDAEAGDLPGWLDALAERELLVAGGSDKFPGERAFAFRHGLTREAAYAMLLDADREKGHRLAGAWLERAGEKDARALADHFERGREPARARAFHERAARLALQVSDFADAMASVERAVALGASGQERGRLRVIECHARAWRGEFSRAIAVGLEGMELLAPEDEHRHQLAGRLLLLCTANGRMDLVAPLLEALEAEPPGETFGSAKIEAWATAAWIMTLAGRRSLARQFLARLALTDAYAAALEPRARAWIHVARYFDAFLGRADPWAALAQAAGTLAEAERMGDRCLRAQALQESGAALTALGAWQEARRALEEGAQLSEQVGASLIHGLCLRFLALALAQEVDLAAGQAVAAAAAKQLRDMGVTSHELSTRAFLADLLRRSGDLDAALAEAERAAESSVPGMRAHGLAVLARVLAARGRGEQALAHAREAMAIREELGAIGHGEAQVPLALAEALLASGDADAARAAALAGRDGLRRRADLIGEPRYRASFLDAVPENRRTLELARELVGD
ncbi:MAG: protein kinase [Myxococcales bacterium]|nr:protein kinase [Myxococcales bacterium]